MFGSDEYNLLLMCRCSTAVCGLSLEGFCCGLLSKVLFCLCGVVYPLYPAMLRSIELLEWALKYQMGSSFASLHDITGSSVHDTG
jgi:hypothetical protein